jgi:hypothetical protein
MWREEGDEGDEPAPPGFVPVFVFPVSAFPGSVSAVWVFSVSASA